MSPTPQQWMLNTLTLAKKRQGACAPNPAVGAVVVKNNVLIAEGFHAGAGFAHAEVEALNAAGKEAIGADLYVSLEPCCHYGRTPPCTKKIITSGIARVFFAYLDPNLIVSGKGQKQLKNAGIACEQIVLPEIDDFYAPYAFSMEHHRPFVTAKLAITADGFAADAEGSPLAITGEECREFTHQHRLSTDAILSTTQTVIADDPQLNVRLDDQCLSKPLYLLDAQARLPLESRIFQTAKSITLFHHANANVEKIKKLSDNRVRCIAVPSDKDRLDLNVVLNHIGRDGMHALWVEAGPSCFASFLTGGLLQRAIIYVSNRICEQAGLSANISIDQLKQSASSFRESKLGCDRVFEFMW